MHGRLGDELRKARETVVPGLTQRELQTVMAAATEVDRCVGGVVAGAVLAAARGSAWMTLEKLARSADVSLSAIAGGEDGTRPLCAVTPDRLARLDAALLRSGADPAIVADLAVASECDILIAGLVHGLDDFLADVPPVDEDDAGTVARELLGWAVDGLVPPRYAAHADPGPLLDAATRRHLALAAQALAWHWNADARVIGRALLALA